VPTGMDANGRLASPRSITFEKCHRTTARASGPDDFGDLSNSYSLLTHMSQFLTLSLRLRKANVTAG
jgi:hypothetical protein